MTAAIESRAIMPDLSRGTRLFRHDSWSAIAALATLGISLERIVIEYAGGGWKIDTVVGQSPAAGTELLVNSRVVLKIAGTGTLESLPFPLREESSEGALRGDRICAILDLPLARLRAYVQSGAGHFRLSPTDPLTARRWIEDVMCASSAPWTSDEWYRVARLMSFLHRIAGRHDAVETALRVVYGLDVQDVVVCTDRLPVEASLATRLGERNGRLGIDAVAGDGIICPVSLFVSIGPVPLATYLQHLRMAAGRAAIYRMVLPAYLPGGVRERWVVAPHAGGHRLGDGEHPSLLGVCSYVS